MKRRRGPTTRTGSTEINALHEKPNPYVSRGGLKLAAALEAFELDVAGFTCADLGCNVGGFTDGLLQRGARHVYAVDTGYGALAWKLRQDARVTVLERTNALHYEPADTVDLVTIDLAWTPQRHAVPAALGWSPRWIITLIKPHYEASAAARKAGGALSDERGEEVLRQTLEAMPALGVEVSGHLRSPIRGGKSKGKAGNTEYLALLRPRG